MDEIIMYFIFIWNKSMPLMWPDMMKNNHYLYNLGNTMQEVGNNLARSYTS